MNSEKTLIGVLASHDDSQTNVALASLFTYFYQHSANKKLDGFHFVITGGTYDRLFFGDEKLDVPPLGTDVANWLRERATPLPSFEEGGIIIFSYPGYPASVQHCLALLCSNETTLDTP